MKKTYTYQVIWAGSGLRKVIKTFTGCKTKVKAENWMFSYIKANGYFGSEFYLKKIEETA